MRGCVSCNLCPPKTPPTRALKVCLAVARSEQKDDPDEQRIQEEIKMYGDILRLDMVDTYADLSLKTLKMFTVLPAKYEADFYFKIDDDVAVNIDAMAAYLAAKRNQGNLYLVSACVFPDRAPCASVPLQKS